MNADEHSPKEHSPSGLEEVVEFQVDQYGVKARAVRRVRDGGEQPRSWQDVWQRAQHHLRRICVDFPGALADTVATVRGFIQGRRERGKVQGQPPDAIQRRIGRAHAVVDTVEDQSHAAARDHGVLPPAEGPNSGVERLTAKLAELRARGVAVELFQHEDGTWYLILAPERDSQDPRFP